MGTGRRPDPRRKKITHAHSTYMEVPNKTKHGGWKAGELYGLYCHHVGHTKPCADDVTNGALKCQYCEAGFNSEFRAYLPLWDREYQLRHVLIGEDFFEAADRIPFRGVVTLSRDASKRSPLRVSDEAMMVRLLPDGPPWDKPVNMLAICLTLWKDDALARWMSIPQPTTPAEKKATPTRSDGQPFSPMTAAAARRFAPPAKAPEPSLLGDAGDAVLRNAVAGKPSTNGHHKRKREE